MKNYAKLSAWLIGTWFVLITILSAMGVLKAGPKISAMPLGLATAIPLLVFFVWFGASREFRQFTMSLNPRTLTMLQGWRVIGFSIAVLGAARLLPNAFAWPAGWGDVAIGFTAPLAAMFLANPGQRGRFIFWQLLGVLDLVTAIVLGAITPILDPHGIQTAIMLDPPLSLIPTFLVPLMLMIHVICIAQARAWSPRTSLGMEQIPGSTAA